MGEKEKCGHECTCKNSLGHYLVVIGGLLRIGSLIFGIAFSSEAAEMNPAIEATKKHLDNIIIFIENWTESVEDK